MPDQGRIREIREPIVTVHLYMPQDYVGPGDDAGQPEARRRRSRCPTTAARCMLTYDMPLAEIVLDFFDKLKSVSRGYASMDYEFKEYRAADVVKVDMLINGDRVDALSIIVHRSQSLHRGRDGGGQDARDHPAPDVRRGHPGGDRRQHHRARDRQGAAQERAGKMLRRRHHPQEASCSKNKRQARNA